jgi:glycosyltransferase involved in cell wall biosynthesis
VLSKGGFLIHQDQLRVVHVAEDMAQIAGGIPAVVRQLTERLSLKGITAQIVHATGDCSDISSSVEVFNYPPTRLGQAWSWGSTLREGVAHLSVASTNDAPVFHVHGAWSAPQYFAARAAYQANIPFIFSAHGMLEPWLWEQQGWKTRAKKRAYWSALAYPSLNKANVIHAITPFEREHLRHLFPKKNIEVIPNAIDVNDEIDCPCNERDRVILFLGRIEPKKGVDVLLHAFARAKISKEWSVDIVGPAWSKAYLSELKKIVTKFNLEKRVRFLGPLFGEEKLKLIETAWVLAVPSHSEVVGLVNLEASAQCLPTITTHQTGLYDWEEGGGLLVEPSIASFGRALEVACSWNEQEQRERGIASRRLVIQRYSWQAVMPIWSQLYSSL